MADGNAPNAPAKKAAYKRRWRNFLLDRRYQLKYTLVMVVIAGVLTAGLGAGILRQTARVEQASAEVAAKAQEASRIVNVQALGDPDDPSVKEMKKAFDAQDAELQRSADLMKRQGKFVPYALGAFFLLLTLFLGAYGIVMTHRVAGPLFKISNYLKRITDGRLGVVYDLRKGDELVDFFAVFKQMHGALKGRLEHDVEMLHKAIESLEALAARLPADQSADAQRLIATLKNEEAEKRQQLE